MRFPELDKHIFSCVLGVESFAPVYLIYGDDDYLRARATDMFRGVLEPDFLGFNFTEFDGEEKIDSAFEMLATAPMLDVRHIAQVNLGGALTEGGREALKKYAASPSPDSILLLQGDAAFFKNVKPVGAQIVDCDSLKDAELTAEISKLLSAPPAKRMDAAAMAELARRTMNSMARISAEIDKLKAYCDGDIKIADVRALVSEDLDFKYYALADAVCKKDADSALKILQFFEQNGVKSVSLINNIYDKYRNLLHFSLNKDMPREELSKLLGVSSGALYYLGLTAQNYTQIRLKNSVDCIHRIQYEVLSGKSAESLAAHECVLELLNI